MSSDPSDFDADQRPDEVEPDDESSEIRTHAVTLEQHGQRLGKLVTGTPPQCSGAHLQGLVEDGRVQVDGKVSSTSSAKVKAGMRVQVELVRPAHEVAFKPEA